MTEAAKSKQELRRVEKTIETLRRAEMSWIS
jgi:hypothetical protein